MSVTMEQVRQLALSLPEATEQPHHDLGSFRVRGKIFATVPDDEHLRLMLDEPEILAAAHEHPDSCHEFYWGKKLSCLVVDLDGVTEQEVSEWLTDAWLRKAPAALAKQLPPER